MPLSQAGFTFSLAAPTTPMLQLRNVLQANVTPSLQADLVYGNGSRMDYQVSLQVTILPTAGELHVLSPVIMMNQITNSKEQSP